MPHSESRKTSSCDAIVFRERPLDIISLTVWNGTHATLEKQEANSGEVSSQHLVGFFKDGCTNLLWRRAAGLDGEGRTGATKGLISVDRGSKATLPLTIPRRVFKSSAKDSARRSMEIVLQGGHRDPSAAVA
ncbi:hypothetical protein CQW23_35334 [Capsicum baccatum]|uniref:Uncharacterized protein n=1 Tax=Capsicum baccatum TaxID=33114 RepID=A0A2G2UWC2_CAPBA|nr:hypothetical protein CQW23_35334 [Capsicum baccatum]